MLTLTQNAVEAITAIKASSEEVPDDAGLRISAEPAGPEGATLHVALVSSPEESDLVVEEEGAQVFLEPAVASFLEDKVLDAEMAEGRVNFALGQQPGTSDDGTVS